VKPFKLPISLVLLNGIGGVLLALGLADLLGDIVIIPQALRINNYQIIMIVIGILLELPLVFNIIRQARGDGAREL